MKFTAIGVGRDLWFEIIGAISLIALSFIPIGLLVYFCQLEIEFYVKVGAGFGITLFVFVLYKTSLMLRNSWRELRELKSFQGCHFEVTDEYLEISSFIMIGEEKEILVSDHKFLLKIVFAEVQSFIVEPARRRVNRTHSPPLYKIILKSGKTFYVLRRVFENERALVDAIRLKMERIVLNDELN
jgi:hypothetical protein